MKIFLFVFSLVFHFVITSCAQDDTVKYEKAVQQKFDQFFHTHDTTFAREVVANCDSVLARKNIGDPKYFYHVYTKATMLKYLGKYNESLETEIRYYAAKDSTSARYYELVALQHKMRGEVQMAKTCYLKAIEKYETYPQTETTLISIAGCYLNMGEEKTAKKKLKEYLKTNDSKVVKEALSNFNEMKKVNSEVIRLMKSESK